MSIVYCVVQFSFYLHVPQPFLLLTLELNSHAIMKAVLINHISKVNPHVHPHFLTMVTASNRIFPEP